MGREVKRVPMGNSIPMGETWWGFLLPAIECRSCNGTGRTFIKEIHGSSDFSYESDYCAVCDGEGKVSPTIPIPEGPAYQMWETVSEGSPISPPFMSQEELAHWLTDNKASASGGETATYEQWLAMIKKGWAPSMVIDGNGLRSGVAAMEDYSKEGKHG